MPTSSQNVDLPFTGGLDQRSSPYTAITSGPLKLFVAQNCRFNRTGMVDRRPGNSVIANTCGNSQGYNTPDISYGGKVTSFRDEAILVYSGPSGASRPGGNSLGGASLGTYSPAQAMLMYKGDIPEVGLSRSPLTTSVIGQKGYDVATGNGYTIYVWGQGASPDIYATIVDNTTNAEVFSSYKVTSAGTVAAFRVCYVAGGTGGKQFVIAYTTTPNNLNVILCSATIPNFAAPVLLKADFASPLEISAMADRWVVAYQTTAALPSTAISLFAFRSAVTQLATGTCSDVIAAATSLSSVAIAGTTGEKVWIAYSRVTGAAYTQRIAAYNPVSLAETLAPVTLDTGADANANATVARFSATEAVCSFDFVTVTLANRGSRTTGYRVTTAGTITSGAALSRNTFWAKMFSKIFVVNGRAYVWVVASGTNLTGVQYVPWTAVLIDLVLDDPSATATPARPVAIDAPRFSTTVVRLASVVALTPTTFLTVGNILRNTTGRSSSTKLTASFTSRSRYQSCELGDTLFFSGGMTSFYDGQRVAEVGFVYYPTTVAATPVQSNDGLGGGLPNGIYYYRAIYTAVDARGNVHRSAPCVPYPVTMAGANNTVAHQIPSLSLTMRQTLVNAGYSTPVGIELYRTTINPSTSNNGLDLEYYRVAKEGGTALNDPTLETITINDKATDGVIATYPQLYTHGNVVSNVQPPGSVSLISHKSRLFAIADDRRTVYYTKQYVEGESPAFADEFTLPFDDGSQLVALASLDANWIIFSKTRIYYVSGDGPNDTTGANDYSFPARVSSEVGCIDPRSICVSSLGIVFQSSIGIYLLTRGLELKYIGAPVADEISVCPVMTSAVVHPTQPQILFTMTNVAGTQGIRLVYDYRVNEWTKDILVTNAGPAVSACLRLGTDYNWADAGGSFWAEDTTGTNFTDAGAWVTMTADLDWVNVAGVQGNQKTHRIKLLGYRYSPCDLSLSRAENYQNTYEQAKLFPDPGLAACQTLPIVQVEIMAAIQKGESTRVRVVDAAPTGGAAIGSGQGISWMCVTIEVDVLSDTMALAAGQRG